MMNDIIKKESENFRKNLGKHNYIYGSLICDIPIVEKKRKGSKYLYG